MTVLTIDKSRLRGEAPNEGAHRLAHWLKPKGRDGWVRLARIGLSATMLERIFDGELVPEGEQASQIWNVTSGAVRVSDWERAGQPWTDEPAERR